jgi:hypothetical protein
MTAAPRLRLEISDEYLSEKLIQTGLKRSWYAALPYSKCFTYLFGGNNMHNAAQQLNSCWLYLNFLCAAAAAAALLCLLCCLPHRVLSLTTLHTRRYQLGTSCSSIADVTRQVRTVVLTSC